MKKILLFLGLIVWSSYSFSQAVTGVTINLPYNWFEVNVNYLPVDTAIAITSTVSPANAAKKTVKVTVDSGDACYFSVDTAPSKLTCTKEGIIKIKAAA